MTARLGVVLTMSAALLVGAVTPAAAHAGMVLTVNDDGRGAITVDVLWDDGHPVTEPITGIMTAISKDGAQVGPAALTRLPGRSAVNYDGTLAPGHWQVTVDLAAPGVGHCEAPVNVGPGAAPHSTRCGDVSAANAVAVRTAPRQPGQPWALWGVVALIVAGTAAAVWHARRR